MLLDIQPLDEVGVEVLPPDIVWLGLDGRPAAGGYGVRGDFAVAATAAEGGAGGLVARNPLATAVTLLLWTDARPPAGYAPARGIVDRRGWVGDGFDVDVASGEAPLGSYLWCFRRSILSPEIGLAIEAEAKRALRPLLTQGAVARIDATMTLDEVHDTGTLAIALYARDGTKLFAAKFDPLWKRVDGGL